MCRGKGRGKGKEQRDVARERKYKEGLSRHGTEEVEPTNVPLTRPASSWIDAIEIRVSPSTQGAVDAVAEPKGKVLSMIRQMEKESDSESDDSGESATSDPQKIKVGKDISALEMNNILPGNLVKVEETSSSTYFCGQTKLIQE